MQDIKQVLSPIIVDSISDNVCILDADGNILLTNKAWDDFAIENGWDPAKTWIGVNYFDACKNVVNDYNNEALSFLSSIRNLLAGKIDSFSQQYNCHSDKTKWWFNLKASMLNINGKKYFLIIHQNITDLIETQNRFLENNQIYNEAQNIAHFGTWDWNIRENTLFWSDEVYRIFGLKPQQFEATYEAFLNTVHPDDRVSVINAVNDAVHKDKPYEIIHRIVLPNGLQRIVKEVGHVYRENDVPIRMLGVVHDITEQEEIKNALQDREEQLLKEKETLKLYFDIVGVMIVVLNTLGNVVLANKKACEVLGYSEDEIIGINWFENCIPERIRDKVYAVFNLIIKGDLKPVERFENLVLTKTGKERLISWTNAFLRDKDGNITTTLSSGEDITDTRSREIQYESILKTAMEGFWVTDLQGNLLDFNKAYSELIGYSRDELQNMKISDVEVIENAEDVKR
ncbi:MAG: PAS domain S-box protein, partial [Thermodesulfovibrionales bacterium]|nr:PAS domain S-box protein [Thermodesulfovibrionales bacterium]